MTPKEYGILQAFPMDDWKQVVSDSQAYKQFGNAVTTTVFTAIAEEIAKSIYAAEESEEQNMEEKTMMPINHQIEPDFLEHIKSTFKRWRDLNTQGVTIGARELSNFAFTLKGASMNSHLGFKYNFNPRGTDADGNPAITLKLYTKPEQMNPAADRPVYEFAAPYMV